MEVTTSKGKTTKMELLALKKLFHKLDFTLLENPARETVEMNIPADTILLKAGSFVQAVPIVIHGLIRASRTEENKELLLYYLHPGEMCTMSFSACCSNTTSLIEAVTLEHTKIILLPAKKVNEYVHHHPTCNSYVSSIFHKRYLDLLDTIGDLIFHGLDERLLIYLKGKAVLSGKAILNITHQQIANELGNAREVVSRLLKKLEGENIIITSRNQITLL